MAAKMIQIKDEVDKLRKQIETELQEAVRHERAAHFHRKRLNLWSKELNSKQSILASKVSKTRVKIIGSPRAPVKVPSKAVLKSVMNTKPPHLKPIPSRFLMDGGGDQSKAPLKPMNHAIVKREPKLKMSPMKRKLFVASAIGSGKIKPSWMSQNTFEKSKCIPMVGASSSVSCPGCEKRFGAKVISKSGNKLYCLEYHIHCIEECKYYKELGAAKTCHLCDLKFLNIISYDYHRLKIHPETMACVTNPHTTSANK